MTDANMPRTKDANRIGLRFGWLIILALGVQVLALGFVNDVSFDAARVLLIASYIILFPAVFVNLKRRGIGLVMVGLVLNFTVISANGGYMPIDPAALGASTENVEAIVSHEGFIPFSKDNAQAGGDANLRVLSDIFPLPGPLQIAYSIGDVFIVAGILFFVLGPLWPRRWSIRQ